jgi:hypothetical protein
MDCLERSAAEARSPSGGRLSLMNIASEARPDKEKILDLPQILW